MRLINAGPPRIVEHDGTRYYQEGTLLIPLEACSCDAYYDPRCAVPDHRAKAKAYGRPPRTESSGRWLERRLRAQSAGPVLVCGQSEAQGAP